MKMDIETQRIEAYNQAIRAGEASLFNNAPYQALRQFE